jgi:hypothetical protein
MFLLVAEEFVWVVVALEREMIELDEERRSRLIAPFLEEQQHGDHACAVELEPHLPSSRRARGRFARGGKAGLVPVLWRRCRVDRQAAVLGGVGGFVLGVCAGERAAERVEVKGS